LHCCPYSVQQHHNTFTACMLLFWAIAWSFHMITRSAVPAAARACSSASCNCQSSAALKCCLCFASHRITYVHTDARKSELRGSCLPDPLPRPLSRCCRVCVQHSRLACCNILRACRTCSEQPLFQMLAVMDSNTSLAHCIAVELNWSSMYWGSTVGWQHKTSSCPFLHTRSSTPDFTICLLDLALLCCLCCTGL
jgi:hypothetical protein